MSLGQILEEEKELALSTRRERIPGCDKSKHRTPMRVSVVTIKDRGRENEGDMDRICVRRGWQSHVVQSLKLELEVQILL